MQACVVVSDELLEPPAIAIAVIVTGSDTPLVIGVIDVGERVTLFELVNKLSLEAPEVMVRVVIFFDAFDEFN